MQDTLRAVKEVLAAVKVIDERLYYSYQNKVNEKFKAIVHTAEAYEIRHVVHLQLKQFEKQVIEEMSKGADIPNVTKVLKERVPEVHEKLYRVEHLIDVLDLQNLGQLKHSMDSDINSTVHNIELRVSFVHTAHTLKPFQTSV
jgi:hypothetical protein